MGKVKTKDSLTNRLKITKNGKVLRRQSFRRHLKAAKSSKQLRSLKRSKHVIGYFAKKVRKIVGNRSNAKMRKVAKVKNAS